MSKNKQSTKEKKKPAAEGSSKAPSDYQSGKKDAVKPIITPAKKK
ncbi:hypothetical protein [Mucilaginibacter sp.]|jgi:hypothetical protein